MFGINSKNLLAASLMGVIAAIAVGINGGNRLGVVLFLSLAIGAAIIGVALALTGIREAVLVDTAATQVHEPQHRTAIAPSLFPMIGATACVAAVLAVVFGFVALGVALALGFIAIAGWFGQSVRENTAWNETVAERARTHLTAPFAVPVLAAGAVLFVAVCISRVLLTASEHGSIIVGVVVSVCFLAGATVASMVRGKKAFIPATLLGLAIVGLGIGGIVGVSKGERKFEAHEPAGEVTEIDVEAAAEGNAFNINRIVVPTPNAETAKQTETVLAAGHDGAPFNIKIKNNSKLSSHNMSFYTSNPDLGGVAVFQGGWVAPGKSTEYYVNPVRFYGQNQGFLDPNKDGTPATYFWRCDIHPNMNGYVTVPSLTTVVEESHEGE